MAGFGKNFVPVVPGKAIEARSINGPGKALEGLARMQAGPGIEIQWVGGIPILSAPGPPGPRYVLTPSGGIPARSGAVLGSAECAFQDLDPLTATLTDAGFTDTVLNASSIAVNGSRYGIAEWVDGAWSIVLESCG